MPRWIARFLLLWLSVGVLHAQSKTEPDQINFLDALDNKHVIGPGYLLSIRILEERRESEQRMVPENGVIEIPHVGPVKVEGMTCRKLSQFVVQKLTSSPAFMQILATQRPFPGSTPPTVSVVIDNLGTCVPFALGNPLKLRPGQTTLDDQEQLNGKTIKYACMPDVVCVVGNVAKAGKYDFPTEREITVSGLLAKAGGHTSKKQIPTIKILRQTPLGTKVILVDSRALLVSKSQKHDLFMRPQDVMLVE